MSIKPNLRIAQVGSVLEIVEEKVDLYAFCGALRSGRLADGRGWVAITEGGSARMGECMRPFTAEAVVTPGAII